MVQIVAMFGFMKIMMDHGSRLVTILMVRLNLIFQGQVFNFPLMEKR